MVVNKPKEKQIRKTIGKVSQDILGKPDAYVQCDKQNNGDAEPLISLWFDRASHQFLESHGSRPIKYVEFNISRKEVACGCEE